MWRRSLRRPGLGGLPAAIQRSRDWPPFHARVVKPDPHANSEFTKKLHEAINIATTYFDSAEHFLMSQRGVERVDAVLIYDGHSRAAGERLSTVEAALAAAKDCPALYQACQEAFSKQCSEPLSPLS